MIVLTGELDPTATYAARSWAFVSNGMGMIDVLDPKTKRVRETIAGDGKLTIRLQHRTRRVLRNDCLGKPRFIEIDTYAVAAVEPQYPGTTAVMLLNLDDPEQREPYLVHVGGIEKCRCMAGDCKVKCKHVDAVTSLLSQLEMFELELGAQQLKQYV